MLDLRTEIPADPMLPRPFRLVSAYCETSDTSTLIFEPADELPSYRFEPAQIGMIGLPGLGEVPISFSSDPVHETQINMTIRRAGAITGALLDLAPGDIVSMRGPYGSPWPLQTSKDRHLLFVAGGLGIVPLRSALLRARATLPDYRSITLVYGVRADPEYLFRDDLRRWSADPSIRVLLTVDADSPAWKGHIGLVTSRFEDALSDPGNTVAMVCGPDVMMKAVGDNLSERGLNADAIWFTLERNMKCAIGLCGHCQFGRFFVCKDGPVFNWRDVEPLYRTREL